MKPKQLKIQFKNGLGKLPTSLISDRERFTLTLWAYFVENGASYMLENKRRDFSDEYSKGYTNDLPKNITDLNELVRLLRSNLFGVDAELIAGKEIQEQYGRIEKRKKIQKPDTIKVSLGKQTFSFDPYYLADSVFRAYGVEGLAPKKKAVKYSEYSLTKDNDQLMKLMSNFVSTDDLRESLQGVNFDENGVAASDGFKVFWIKGKALDNGLYNPKTSQKIDRRFPQYLSIFPEKQLLSFTVDTKEFTKTLLSLEPSYKEVVKKRFKIKQVVCVLNDGILELIHDNEDYSIDIRLKVKTDYSGPKFVFGFDLVHIKGFLNSVVKLTNPKSLTIQFTQADRGFTVNLPTPFGDSVFLLMPIILVGKYYQSKGEFAMAVNEYLKKETESNAPAKPTANIKILKLKGLAAKAKLKLALI